MEVPRAVEPVLAVEPGDIYDERIALPAADGVPHIRIVRRRLYFIEIDRACSTGKRERHVHFVRALHDLEGVGHVHRPRDPRQIALQFRIAVDPVLAVLLSHGSGFGLVRNLTVAFHDPDRSRHSGGGSQREHGRSRHLRVRVRVHTLLRHRSRARLVRLQVPVRFVQRLPDAAEIRFPVGGPGCTGRRSRSPPP